MFQFKHSQDKSTPQKNYLVWIFLFSFLIIASLTAYLAFSMVQNAVSSSEKMLPQPDIREPIATLAQGVLMDVSSPLFEGSGPPPHPWDGQSQVTILLLGVDHRDWDADNGPPFADTIILATIDPQEETAGMLSIPRDLWVSIPGYGYNKINQAYRLGEVNQEPQGGAGLVMDTIKELMEITIPYYALIDFTSFIHVIDEIGGVRINVPESVKVDPLGDHNTQILQPGVQMLSGDIALAYVRNRDTFGSDFDRAERQQQVIIGIQERLISFDLLPSLIEKAPILYNQIASGTNTNLTLQQVVQLSWLSSQIPREKIRKLIIGPDQVINAVSYEGMAILQPIPEEILGIRDKLFSPESPYLSEIVMAMSITERVIQENAKVAVNNGTFTAGLAAQTGEFLAENNINVINVSNADQFYEQTTIINFVGKPYTLGYLADILNVPPGKIYQRYDPNNEEDILIVLGEDWAIDNDMPQE
jgi:LCP family protein required for cell wall assembly